MCSLRRPTTLAFGEIQVYSLPSLATSNIPSSGTEDVLAEPPPRAVRPPLMDLPDTPRPLREFTIILLFVADESTAESSDEEVTCSG
ncbi:unnamed protein product [Danaus chrysippus]|uniref:(African queen) hypothetical protein n=1 Tax=Danaus chrysippus TaxID=151541 RepID=A0A8J2QBC7_9NEOP|nr:unnamed protein product [Danaus chrysippus]CAG9562269.1 unnamed protein product [Danaus chrysippus]